MIGFPLTHSFSKKYFTDKFTQEEIPAEYLNFEIKSIDLFPSIIQQNPLLKGLNVTIPYKELIIPYMHEVDEHALAIGAINCIQVNNQLLKGYNTDYLGFIEMIQPMLKSNHQKAVIFGNGGASKAIQYAFKILEIDYILLSRNGLLNYENCTEEVLSNATIWVNTTPIGMFPNVNEKLPLHYDLITKDHLVIDLIYNPATTKFLEQAQLKGASVLNGYSMLINQAEHAWKIWNNSI